MKSRLFSIVLASTAIAAFGLGPIGAPVGAAAEPPSAAGAEEKKVDPKILDSYVGQYELQPGFVITIRRKGDGITGQATGQPIFDLFARSETNFFLKVVDAQITFVHGADGKIGSLILHQNGDNEAKKISDQVPKPRVPDLTKIPPRDPKASVAWKGANAATEQFGASLRLFKITRDNPQPDLVVESVDFISAMDDPAPFLIAITIE